MSVPIGRNNMGTILMPGKYDSAGTKVSLIEAEGIGQHGRKTRPTSQIIKKLLKIFSL